MFSKSKRFDEKVPIGPSVGAYDVKLPVQGSTGPTTFDRSQRWGKKAESSSRGKENLNVTADEGLIRATLQKELFSSARKPAASVSKVATLPDHTATVKLKQMELELCRLRQEKMSLLREVGVVQEEATRAEQQLLSCRRDKVSLESGLASLQKERAELRASVTKLEGMVAKHESSKQASAKVHLEAANLRHQLEVVQSELVTVRQEWQAASRKAEEAERAMDATTASFTEQLAAKEVDFVLFSARLNEECDSRLKLLKESMDTAKSEFETQCKQLTEAVQSERKSCEQQVSALTEQLQTETGRVVELVAEVQSLGTQLSAAGEKERTLRDQYKQKEAEYASMLEEVKSQNDMNMQALQSMTAKCMEIEDELDHERKSYKQAQVVTKAELVSTQNALKAMTAEKASLSDAYRDLQRRLSVSEMSNTRLEAELEVVRHTADSTEQKMAQKLSQAVAASEELKERLGVREEEVRVLQGQKSTLEQLVQSKGSELERVLGEFERAEASTLLVSQLEYEIDVLKTEKTELSLNADKWKKEFYELQSKYLPYQDQIDQLVSRIKGLQSQSDLAESEAVRIGQQFAQLVGHTNHRQKIQYVQKLTNENLSLKKEVMHLRDEEMKAKKKLRALEDESSRLGVDRKPLATRNC